MQDHVNRLVGLDGVRGYTAWDLGGQIHLEVDPIAPPAAAVAAAERR
jgi:hypothetical protein